MPLTLEEGLDHALGKIMYINPASSSQIHHSMSSRIQYNISYFYHVSSLGRSLNDTVFCYHALPNFDILLFLLHRRPLSITLISYTRRKSQLYFLILEIIALSYPLFMSTYLISSLFISDAVCKII